MVCDAFIFDKGMGEDILFCFKNKNLIKFSSLSSTCGRNLAKHMDSRTHLPIKGW